MIPAQSTGIPATQAWARPLSRVCGSGWSRCWSATASSASSGRTSGVRVASGPSSTNRVTPCSRQALIASWKRTVAPTCPIQYSSVIGVPVRPVTVETIGMLGSETVRPSIRRANSSSMGRVSGE